MRMRKTRRGQGSYNMIKKLAPWLLGCALFGIGAFHSWDRTPVEVGGTVDRSDGDSFWIDNSEIRLFGIDAFEAGQPCEIDGHRYDCGAVSIAALRDLTRQGVTCTGASYDRYDRLLAVCFAQGRNINAAMVERGHALAYRRYSRDYLDEERKADAAKAGAWAGDFQAPWEYRAGE